MPNTSQILKDAHWVLNDYRQRMTAKEWSKVLLDSNDSIVFKGKVLKLKAKNLGYGIVEVSKDFSSESK